MSRHWVSIAVTAMVVLIDGGAALLLADDFDEGAPLGAALTARVSLGDVLAVGGAIQLYDSGDGWGLEPLVTFGLGAQFAGIFGAGVFVAAGAM